MMRALIVLLLATGCNDGPSHAERGRAYELEQERERMRQRELEIEHDLAHADDEPRDAWGGLSDIELRGGSGVGPPVVKVRPNAQPPAPELLPLGTFRPPPQVQRKKKRKK
jgi:hypothetical protein